MCVVLRFSDAITEWLALWIHFVWSGILTVIFCSVGWREIGFVIAPALPDGKNCVLSSCAKEAMNKRRRLLWIAVIVVIALLLNVVATLSTSAKMEEWNRTADLSLTCTISETWLTRNLEAYGIGEEAMVTVCEAKDVTKSQHPCTSACFYLPSTIRDFSDETLTCEAEEGDGYGPCDCPCYKFIQIEKPRFKLRLCCIPFH